jgi:hypothetical protein
MRHISVICSICVYLTYRFQYKIQFDELTPWLAEFSGDIYSDLKATISITGVVLEWPEQMLPKSIGSVQWSYAIILYDDFGL